MADYLAPDPPAFVPIPPDPVEVSVNGGPWVRVPRAVGVAGDAPVFGRPPEPDADTPHVTPAM